MASWPGAGGGGGFDYVQAAEPSEAVEGEEWFDTSTAEAKVYDGTGWHLMTVGDFKELAGKLAASQIPDDVIASRMVASGTIDPLHLSFDPASQGELDTHAGDTTNPHNVTDSQTGAASALSNHAGQSDVHHGPGALVADPSAVSYGVNLVSDATTAGASTGNGSWSNTGKTVTLDLRGVAYLEVDFEFKAGTDQTEPNYIRLRGRESGETVQASTSNSRASYRTRTGRAEVRNATNEVFDVQVMHNWPTDSSINPITNRGLDVRRAYSMEDVA